ncbi:MAG: phospholipid scramblase-related protein [Anaeromyxobacter sp.]
MRRSAPPSVTAPLATTLDAAPRLVVRQARDWAELVGWESPNRYALLTEDGALAGWALEETGGAGRLFARWFLKANRPFEMRVVAASEGGAGPRALQLRRPFTWLFARLEVTGEGGQPLGTIQQRFSLLRRKLDVVTPDGRLLARIVGPWFRPWTFVVLRGESDVELGRIEKRWSGAVSELFTDADTFLVTFGRADAALRRLLLAAAVLVDFRWFENTE